MNLKLFRFGILMLSLVALAALVACSAGGSTQGTGGRSIVGSVRDLAGVPVEGVVVTNVESGDTASTGADGVFTFAQIQVDGQEFTFDFRLGNFNAQASFSAEVPPDNVTIVAQFVVDLERNQSTVVSVEVFEDSETASPTSTAAATPSARAPTATPNQNQPGGGTPTVPASQTVQPGPTQAATPVSPNPVPTSTPGSEAPATPVPEPTIAPSATPTPEVQPTAVEDPAPTAEPTPTSTPVVGCRGDLNFDGFINQEDLDIIIAINGTQIGQPGYRADADFNSDGVISISDIAVVTGALGQSC